MPNYHPTELYAAKPENPHSQPTETLTSPENMPTGVGVLDSHGICRPISFHQAPAAPVTSYRVRFRKQRYEVSKMIITFMCAVTILLCMKMLFTYAMFNQFKVSPFS
ncbi:hypothetical protein I3843_15G089700 [Carya illinoinensis]|nr:hypothetical protein I3843_15G089700 [Carya illinoinensis]